MWSSLIEFIETTSRVSIEALLNGLWQGVALTLVIWALVKFAPRLHPRGRFAIWAATLAVIVGLPFITGQRLLPAALAKYFIAGSEQRTVVPVYPASDKLVMASAVEESSPTSDLNSELMNSKSTDSYYSKDGVSGSNGFRVYDALKADHATEHAKYVSRANHLAGHVTHAPYSIASTTGGEPQEIAASQAGSTTLAEEALLLVFLSRDGALALFGIWLMISVALLLRLVYSYWRLQELQASASEAPEGLQLQFAHWIVKQEITRNVKLLVSSEISVPLAVGFGAPAVILPKSIIKDLSLAEFDLVFVHELAHLKRRDDLSVFGQQIAKALFFVNPATIWIARRMDFEREVACDNEVVAYLGSPRKYAACLARLAELSTTPRNSALVAGTFIRKNSLVERVERLLDSATIGNSRFSRMTVVGSFAVLALAVAQFTLIPAVIAVEESQNETVVIAPRASNEYTSRSDRSRVRALDRKIERFEDQRQNAQEKLESLQEDLAKFQEESQRNTPERQSKLKSYQRRMKQYERNLEKALLSLEKVSEAGNLSISKGTLGHITVPDNMTAPLIIYGRDGSGYSYSYSHGESIVGVPLVSLSRVEPIKPITPITPIAPSSPHASDVSGAPSYPRAPSAPRAPQLAILTPPVLSHGSSSGVIVSTGDDAISISIPSISIDGNGNWDISSDDGNMNFNWSDGRHKIQVRAKGEVKFTDDESDILSISDNGSFSVHERDRGFDREYEVLADDGELDKTYYEDGRRSDLDVAAKEWIQETILFVLRNSTIGAKERAQKILDRDGIDGLLKEIELIESDYVKRAYYSASFSSGNMNSEQTCEGLSHLAREVSSDYEKAQILSNIDEDDLQNDETLAAYVNVVKSIDSDYEKRRALDAISDRKKLSRKTILAILKMARSIGSDYERAELLSDMTRYTEDDEVFAQAYYDAIVDIESSYEKRRVLSKFLKRSTMNEAMALNVLNLAESIHSDYERAELLIDVSRFNQGKADFYLAYIDALRDIDSDYETHRALDKLDIDTSAPNKALIEVLEIIDNFSSDYEKAGALKKIARLYTDDDMLNDAFLDVVDQIDSDYERERVLSAWYKAERAKSKSRRSRIESRNERSSDGRD